MGKKVSNGNSKEINSAVLRWSSMSKEERKEVCFNDLVKVWEVESKLSLDSAELWLLLKTKAKTFEEFKWLFERLPSCSPERGIFWRSLRETAVDFCDYVWLWKKSSEISYERTVFWGIVKQKAETVRQCDFLCSEAPEDSYERKEALELLKSKTIF